MRPDGQGFAIAEGVLPASEIGELVKHLPVAQGRRSRAGSRNLIADPVVLAVARDPRLRGLASQALGAEASPFKATLFHKSLSANWLVAWHQDTALPIRARREVPGWGPWSVKAGVRYAIAPAQALSKIVALRLHLDDSLAANGPLRVLPDTHRLGVLPSDRIAQLSSTVIPVQCTVAKGGVITMSPLLVHASSKATIPSPRRVVHIEYATSTDLGDGLELDVA
jgi:hypothetical protein